MTSEILSILVKLIAYLCYSKIIFLWQKYSGLRMILINTFAALFSELSVPKFTQNELK